MKNLKFVNGQVKDDDCPHLTLEKPPGHKYYRCATCGKQTRNE